jgi:3-dehydroquinate dehydratase II
LARIFVLNRVNLGPPGGRRPEIYGDQTPQGMEELLRGGSLEAEFVRLTYYSYAIHDALETVSVPKVEVDLSNVHSGEEVSRHASVTYPVVEAVAAGMGVQRPGEIHIPVGVFDDLETFEPREQSWASHRLSWFELGDDLRRHARSSKPR